MSLLTLQVGQCGNQLGPSLFDFIASEYAHPSGKFYDHLLWNPFFRLPCAERGERDQRPIARSILIDMEPSVVESALINAHRKSSRWTYSRPNCFFQQSGSGNNWAMGFADHGPRVKDSIIDIVRKELEMTDYFGGFLILQSMAGGTGSGLGAFLTNALTDDFSKSFVLNYCIWPFRIGEVIVQSYNALLTLSSILDTSHGIFLAENDALSAQCQAVYRIQHPSFEDMNQDAMRALAGCLLPSKIRPITGQSQSKHAPGSWTRMVSDFISVLCPSRCLKLLSCQVTPQLHHKCISYATFDWDVLLRQMHKHIKTGKQNRRSQAFAHFLTLRGRHAITPDVSALSDERLYVRGLPQLGVAYSPAKFGGYEMSLSLTSNAQRNAFPVVDALVKAKRMFKSRAFLHCYSSHGVQKQDFQNTFRTIQDHVIEPYQLS